MEDREERFTFMVEQIRNFIIHCLGFQSTAEKKARHYRDQNNCGTRVISVKEDVTYSYDYSLVNDIDNK